MTTETITIAEMTEDAKQVYKVGPVKLAELADKYGVTTHALSFHREREGANIERAAIRALGSKSGAKELQSKLYAAIKTRIADSVATGSHLTVVK